MKHIIILGIILVFSFAFAGSVLGDCMDLSGTTSWYVQDSRTIIYYAGNRPVAKIVLQDCEVSSSSSIRLPKSYMCDEDSLIVDGQECGLMDLTSVSF